MSNMTDFWLSGVIFQVLNTPKLVFDRGSAPDPAAKLTMLPKLLSRLGNPSLPSASRSRRFRFLSCQAPNTNSWLRLSWTLISFRIVCSVAHKRNLFRGRRKWDRGEWKRKVEGMDMGIFPTLTIVLDPTLWVVIERCLVAETMPRVGIHCVNCVGRFGF